MTIYRIEYNYLSTCLPFWKLFTQPEGFSRASLWLKIHATFAYLKNFLQIICWIQHLGQQSFFKFLFSIKYFKDVTLPSEFHFGKKLMFFHNFVPLFLPLCFLPPVTFMTGCYYSKDTEHLFFPACFLSASVLVFLFTIFIFTNTFLSLFNFLKSPSNGISFQ